MTRLGKRGGWRSYYVLTFSDGTCAPYAYRNRLNMFLSGGPRSTIRPHVVGVLHVKGKTPAAQQAIYARCIDKERYFK